MRAAQAAVQRAARRGRPRSSSRSRCSPPRAAASRSSAASSRRGASGSPPSRSQLAEPDLRSPGRAEAALRRRRRGPGRRRGAAARAERAGAAPRRGASRQRSSASTPRAARQAELGARLEALRALQEKVQTEGKLKPWLARHGLDGLQGLWTRIHIESGWETALEAALRERLGALAGRPARDRARLRRRRAAGQAGLLHAARRRAIANSAPARCRGCRDLLRLGDAGLQALLNDWLEGVYTAAIIDDALAARAQLTHGEVIMTREGHAVSQYAVSFYAPDSEQAGMLARAQEIENLDRQVRAQALIADEARSALVRAEAAYTEASQRLAGVAARSRPRRRRVAHQLQVELLRLTQQAEQTGARREQLDDGAGRDRRPARAELEAAAAPAKARFEELDVQLGDDAGAPCRARGRGDRAPSARSPRRASSCATLERQARGGAVRAAHAGRAARRAAARASRPRPSRSPPTSAASRAAARARAASTDDSAQAGAAGSARAQARARGRARRAPQRLRRPDRAAAPRRRAAPRPRAEPGAAARAHHQAAARGAGRAARRRSSTSSSCTAAAVDLEALAAGIEDGGVKLAGLQGEIDRLNARSPRSARSTWPRSTS